MSTATPSKRAWIGVLVPPLAWATQLLLSYSIVEAACVRPDGRLWGAGVRGLAAITVVVCGSLALAAGVAASLAWRSARTDEGGLERFFGLAGLIGAPIFVFAIVLSGIALVPLPGCRPG
jgi:hypothetical protein